MPDDGMSGDAIGCAAVLLAASLVITGGLTALIVFGAREHSVPVIAVGGSSLLLIVAAVAAHAWSEYREYRPRERRIVQKGARWP